MTTEIEIGSIEHIEVTDPEDYASRQARLRAELRMRDMARDLELVRDVKEPKSAPRVPRNAEPAPLWLALTMLVGIVFGLLLTGAFAIFCVGSAIWVVCAMLGIDVPWLDVAIKSVVGVR